MFFSISLLTTLSASSLTSSIYSRSLSSQSKPCMASLATSLSTSLSASCIKPEEDKSNKIHETDSSGNSNSCFIGESGMNDSRSRLPDNQLFLQQKIKTETCDTGKLFITS